MYIHTQSIHSHQYILNVANQVSNDHMKVQFIWSVQLLVFVISLGHIKFISPNQGKDKHCLVFMDISSDKLNMLHGFLSWRILKVQSNFHISILHVKFLNKLLGAGAEKGICSLSAAGKITASTVLRPDGK